MVNFTAFLDRDVPRSMSCGAYISQLIRFARIISNVTDSSARYESVIAKPPTRLPVSYTSKKFFQNFIAGTMIYCCS